MDIYLSGVAILFLLAVYAPLAIGLLAILIRRLPRRGRVRWPAAGAAALALTLVPTWDVALTGLDMRRRCATEAGTFVHRSVEVAGFLSDTSGGTYLLQEGYRYVELERYDGKTVRVTADGDQIVSVPVSEPVSRFRFSNRTAILGNRITRTDYVVTDRVTGEVLGRTTSIHAFPGWLDRALLRYFGPITWTCERTASRSALRMQVLIPQP